MEKKYCTVMVLAAGKGSRMGGKTAKQYMEIGGRPLAVHVLEVSEVSPVIDEIVLITDVGYMEYMRTGIMEAYGLKKVSTIGARGDERHESVWKVLCTLTEREEEERESAVRDRQGEYVFIHDGARPFVTGEITEWAYRAVCSYNACVVGMPAKGTIKLMNQEGMIEFSPDRSMVQQAQTPQVLSVPLIVEAFIRQMKVDCTSITDDAMVVETQMGVKAQMVMGSYASIKITTLEDLFMAEVPGNPVVWLWISGLGDTG